MGLRRLGFQTKDSQDLGFRFEGFRFKSRLGVLLAFEVWDFGVWLRLQTRWVQVSGSMSDNSV